MASESTRHLQLLSDFARILSEARGFQDIARQVVKLVMAHLNGDQCHLYVVEPDRPRLRLAATSSSRPVGEVVLDVGEGLTGMVAQTMEGLNVANGPRMPGFRKFSEIDEDHLLSYLGVPLVTRGRCNGVLVIRSTREEIQSTDNEMLIVALASQLATVVDSARLLEALESRTPGREQRLRLLDDPSSIEAGSSRSVPAREMQVLRGFAAAPGMALGPVFRHGIRHGRTDLELVPSTGTPAEEESFAKAIEACLEDIRRSEAVALELVGQELSFVFGAQALLLNDPVFHKGVRERIQSGETACIAVFDSVEALVGTMRQARSDYLRERAEDFADIGRMLVGKLLGEAAHDRDARRAIVFAQALSPGDLVLLASRGAKGFVTGEGGTTSHVSLMSRALNLPAITGVGSVVLSVPEGAEILLDAVVGNVFVHPSKAVLDEYRKVAEIEEARVEVGADRELLGPCRLASGEEVRVCANVGLLRELSVASRRGADGVGLYRTEFPFLMRRDAPTEAQQMQVYLRAFQDAPNLPITFRTLDLGGDKIAPFLQGSEGTDAELEDNPFLGQRSIRLSLAHPELFRTQLRALLRACEGHRGKILFPMISAVDEMKEVLRHVDLARAELRARGTSFQEDLQVGAMIEVPAAVEIVPHLAHLVDFLSVGTNDLLQYTVAADRGNRKVASLASNYHPALLSMLSRLAWESTKSGLEVSVCGEMAADPACALFLAGIQVDVLSMDSRYIPRTKVLLRGYDLQELKEIAGGARKLATASEVNRFLHQRLRLPENADRLLSGGL
jgi:phosphotransferase system enzyme I (PtsP)